MPTIPTRKEWEITQERLKYEDGEKLKVLKKYAQRELDNLNHARYPAFIWCGSKMFLKFCLESECFGDIPPQPFPKEAITEIYQLPFMHPMTHVEDDLEDLYERERLLKEELAKVQESIANSSPKVSGKIGGGANKENKVILKAIFEFIKNDDTMHNYEADKIGKRFKKMYSSFLPCKVVVEGKQYGVYIDGTKIYCECLNSKKEKYHNKTMAYSTFKARYISKAKKLVTSKQDTISKG